MGIYRKHLFVLFVFLLSLFISAQALININTAGVSELKTLNGIGDVKAGAIIDYRTQNGPFAKIEDIKNVTGIGDVTYANIKDFITVGSVADNTGDTQIPQAEATISQSSSKAYWLTDDKSSSFRVSIGVDRVRAVGTPLDFEAETNFGFAKNNIFEWNLGDGSLEYGPNITHTYFYPGEYVVVLNVKVPTDIITVRINVKVVASELVISQVSSERIEISNNSSTEVDLYGRTLISLGKSFSFPKNTLILPKQKISFMNSVTGLYPFSVSDVYLMTVGDNPNQSINGVLKSEEMRLKDISRIESELTGLQNKLVLAYSNTQAKKTEPIQETIQTDIEPTSQTASVISAVDLGWFAKLKQFFLRTQ